MSKNALDIWSTLLIAEVALAHDGSLGIAHSFIDAVAETGADAIKFQTHIADHESTIDESFRVSFSYSDQTRFEYWQRTGFTESEWSSLALHAREKGLLFLSSPFSIAAVHLLDRVGVDGWKIGSGEFFSPEIIDLVSATGQPVLVSTGLSTLPEIDRVVSDLQSAKSPYALLQCTSKYPTKLDDIGLNVAQEMRERYDCPIGLSDHSGVVFPALAALARGFGLVEVHVTFDRRMFGPDNSSSLTMDELSFLVEAKRAFAIMDAHPVDKSSLSEEVQVLRQLFGKSIAPTKRIPAGTILTEDMLTLKKPGSGIALEEFSKVLGRRVGRNVEPNRLLRWEDFLENG